MGAPVCRPASRPIGPRNPRSAAHHEARVGNETALVQGDHHQPNINGLRKCHTLSLMWLKGIEFRDGRVWHGRV